MTPTENLFIRACKTADPHKRVRSVYRRFYGNFPTEETNKALVIILAGLCDRYKPFKAADLLSKVHPSKLQFTGDYHIDWMRLAEDALIHQLRYTRSSELPGVRIPTKFARKYHLT